MRFSHASVSFSRGTLENSWLCWPSLSFIARSKRGDANLVAPDAPEAAAPAPAVAPLAPGNVGSLLMSSSSSLQAPAPVVLAEGARLVLDRLAGALAQQRLPGLAQAPVGHAEEDMVDHAVGIAMH